MKFKSGDKVKCSKFLYKEDNRYMKMIGTFIRYNRLGSDISYVRFGQFSIACDTYGIKFAKIVKGRQLLFAFMMEYKNEI